MDKYNFRLKIYGVRGSYPPTNGDHTTFGVNTTCIRVDIGQNIVIFDAGTGIINAGGDLLAEFKNKSQNLKNWKLHLLFTHTHIDHLMGFPYFPLIYFPQTEIHYLAPRILNYRIEEIIEYLMSPALFPVTMAELPSQHYFYEIGEGSVIYFFKDKFEIHSVVDSDIAGWEGRISCIRNYTHPKGGTYIYKIEKPSGNSIVFATDIEGFVGGDQRLIKFARNADILIHDAQYNLKEYKMFQGFGHSTYEMACQVAKEAGVGKLLLFHHDPKHSDGELLELESAAKKLFPETYIASENMEFFI